MSEPRRIIVGFAGRSGSGKSEIARALRVGLSLPRAWVAASVHRFAEPILLAAAVFGVEKGRHPAFRRFAQRIGDAVNSELTSEALVQWQRDDLHEIESDEVVIYDDVRWQNQADFCDISVKLVTSRPNGLSPEEMLHPTETSWESMRTTHSFCTDDWPACCGAVADAVVGEVRERLKR